MQTLGSTHNYSTRNKDKISYDSHNLKFLEKKPSYAGIKYYNKLPDDLTNISDFSLFKKELKKYMLKKPIYSLNEFF